MRPAYADRARRSTTRRVKRDPAGDGVGDLVDHVARCASRSHLDVEPVIGGLDHMQRGATTELFAIRARPMSRLDAYPYAIGPDARQILINTLVEEASSNPITLVANWTRGLKK